MSTITGSPLTQQITLTHGDRELTTVPFQLLQWKSALGLEEKGMTMSRGQKVSTHIRRELGLKRSVSIPQLRMHVAEALHESKINANKPLHYEFIPL